MNFAMSTVYFAVDITNPNIMTLDEFFDGLDDSRKIFDTLSSIILDLADVDLRVTKSQIAYHRERTFAWAWIPGKYLRGRHAPLVLTLALRRRDPSPRWKEIVEPVPGRYTHHLELFTSADIDAEVINWIWEAWAGSSKARNG